MQELLPKTTKAPPQGNHVPSQEQVPLGYQAPVDPPTIIMEKRSYFQSLAQVMITGAQAITTKVQALMTYRNTKVGPFLNY